MYKRQLNKIRTEFCEIYVTENTRIRRIWNSELSDLGKLAYSFLMIISNKNLKTTHLAKLTVITGKKKFQKKIIKTIA